MSEFEELAKIVQKRGKICLARNTKYHKLKISKKRFLVYDNSVGLLSMWEGTGLYDFKTGFDGRIIDYVDDGISVNDDLVKTLLDEIKTVQVKIV